jgi:hypothetical protein
VLSLKSNAEKLKAIEPKDLFILECQADEPLINSNKKGKTIFKCQFCSKSYVREYFLKKHEEKCKKS